MNDRGTGLCLDYRITAKNAKRPPSTPSISVQSQGTTRLRTIMGHVDTDRLTCGVLEDEEESRGNTLLKLEQKCTVLWDDTPFSLGEVHRRFGVMYCSHFQG